MAFVLDPDSDVTERDVAKGFQFEQIAAFDRSTRDVTAIRIGIERKGTRFTNTKVLIQAARH